MAKPENVTTNELVTNNYLTDRQFKRKLKEYGIDWAIQEHKESPYVGEHSQDETVNKAERALLLYYLIRIDELLNSDSYLEWVNAFPFRYYQPFETKPDTIKQAMRLDLSNMFTRMYLQENGASLEKEAWNAYLALYLAGLTRLSKEQKALEELNNLNVSKSDFLANGLDQFQNNNRIYENMSELNKNMGVRVLKNTVNKLNNEEIAKNSNDTPDNLTNALKVTAIYELMSSSFATRLQNTGYVKGANALGFSTVEYVAVIDSRTTKICRKLDGTIWRIPEVINYYDDGLKAENVNDLARFNPFNVEEQELENLGVKVPPRHFNCRSSLIIT